MVTPVVASEIISAEDVLAECLVDVPIVVVVFWPMKVVVVVEEIVVDLVIL